MPGLLAIPLVLLALLIVVALYGLVVIILTPYVLYVLSAGFLAGLVLALVETTRTYGGLLDPPRARTPRDQFTAVRPRRSSSRHIDYAWSHYAVWQAGYDLWAVVERCHRHVTRSWTSTWRSLPRLPRYHRRYGHNSSDGAGPDGSTRTRTWTVLLAWPVLALPGAGLAGLTVGVVTGVAVLSVVVVAVFVSIWIFGTTVTAGLRVVDRRWRASWHTQTCCTHCYYLVDLPVFACPTTHPSSAPTGSDRHRALRPGMQGLWRRRCGCGTSLPVRQASAGARLTARCPKCDTPLATSTGRATEIRVAVFGAPDAGKSTLVDAMVAALAARFPPDRCAVVRWRDERGGPRAVGVTLQAHRAPQRVQVFDAPGRGLVDREICANYGYLDNTRNFVFVLDPLSLPRVREQVAGLPPHLVPIVRVAEHDLVDSYEAVVVGMRYRGVDTSRCRLAIVVSKGDLLSLLPGVAPLRAGSTEIERLLVEQGLDGLLMSANRDFGEVRYFLHGQSDPPSPGPLMWLLRGERALRSEVTSALR
ncbi:hypothetical protein IW249_005053 [Micromonospora vinacea]|uniref:50S ribosome-binding GTPase n=1 Tax=Micromonospora vinacea TaxID=709878 RepID=A0ABS0K7P2_9ACTN|nr:hypothetical protein [Micromonospora vinacea]MBG6104639.1 hypothetical protein [Micromonospora vinacea]